ncbi:MAG: hypothetical protein PVI99_00740 [Anaerolineales bacterium]|jgi:hypothetical protein
MAEQIDEKTIENMKLEYNALRNEIVERIGLRQQMLSITLTVTGVVLGFGVTNGTIALILPPLILFLVSAWAQNDLRIRDAAIHIREEIEAHVDGLQWEARIQEEREKTKSRNWRRTLLSHGGIFISAQLIAVLVGITQYGGSDQEKILMAVDAVSILTTLILLRAARR